MRSEILKAAVEAAHANNAEAIEKSMIPGGSKRMGRKVSRALVPAEGRLKAATKLADAFYYSRYGQGVGARTMPARVTDFVFPRALNAMSRAGDKVGRLENARDYLRHRQSRKSK
jgi:hypothetical protein